MRPPRRAFTLKVTGGGRAVIPLGTGTVEPGDVTIGAGDLAVDASGDVDDDFSGILHEDSPRGVLGNHNAMAMERHVKAERREIPHIRRPTGSSRKSVRDGEERAGAKREENRRPASFGMTGSATGCAKAGLVGVGVGVGFGFEAGAGDQSAEGFFAAGAALGSGNIAVAVDHDVDGIDVSLVHGGEIGVFHHDELAVAGMLLEIFFDGLFGLAHVDGEKNQSFAGELMADLVDEGGFVSAKAAPSGPEFEKDDFAFDGVIGEFFAGDCGGVEARGGLFVLGGGKRAKSREDQDAGNRSPQEDGSERHGGNVTEWSRRLSITLLVRSKAELGDRGKVKIPTLKANVGREKGKLAGVSRSSPLERRSSVRDAALPVVFRRSEPARSQSRQRRLASEVLRKVPSSMKTKAQQEPSALRAKRYVPRMSTMVRGVPTRGRSRVCQSLAALLKNSAR